MPIRLVASMDRHARFWCENPAAPRLHTPLPTQPIPEPTQRLGMGPRNQARRVSANRPTDGNRVIAFGRILGLHGLGKECKSSGQRTPNHLIPRLVFCPFLPVRGIDPDQPPRFSVNPRIAYPAAREHEGMDCPVGFNDCESQILVSRKVGKGIDVVPHAVCRA